MRVLLTGASGLVGRVLRSELAARHELLGLDRAAPRRGEVVRADMTSLSSVERHFEGVDAVVDLAGSATGDETWEDIVGNNAPATLNAIEASRRAGVRRYVFASSNHVTGLYEADEPYASIVAGRTDALSPDRVRRLTRADPIRPDGPYGVGKALGEAAARYAGETGGPAAICLRIGTVNAANRPASPRHFATLLTHADLGRLVDCCLGAPDELRFGIYYGVSANTWRFWDIEDARSELGYEPEDDAERFRDDA